MVTRYERDDEVVPLALKRLARGVANANRATGTEIRQTADKVEGMSADVAEALAEAQQAIEDAANALTTSSGKNARRRGPVQPDPPPGGWVQGDQWVVDNYDGNPVELKVWNGSEFVHEQLLSSELLILSTEGIIRLADGVVTAEAIAADAIDAMTIRGVQIYSGYIEAPVIASSDKLGSGTNVLNDPDFTSAVNTAWVASGHLGDANRTQTDTVNWSGTFNWQHQLYPAAYTAVQQNGSAIFDAVLSARPRKTGTLLFANHAWFNDAARTFSNPYSYPSNPAWPGGGPDTPGGIILAGGTGAGATDITFMQLDSREPLAGTARTTYLTNSAVVAVTSGERWNARLTFSKISAAQLELLSSMTVEVINSATNAVLWSRPLEDDELQAGAVNAWWDSTFTGNVKMRVKAVYAAAAGLFMRRPRLTSYAYRYHNSSVYRLWQAAASDHAAYGRYVTQGQSVTDIYPGGTYAAEMSKRLTFEVTLSSALFAQVEPEAGWRLTPEDGLELFNSLGARTGKIDGESNYLAGVFATQESGRRLQIEGEELQWFTAAGVERSTISEDADGVHVAGQGLTLNGNPVWGVYAQAQSLGTTTITNMGTNLTAVPAPAALSLSRVIPRAMRIRIELEVMLNVNALVAVGVALEGANVRTIVRDYMQHGIAYGGATLTAFCSHEMDVVPGLTTFRLVAGTWASSGVRIIEGAKIRILAAR